MKMKKIISLLTIGISCLTACGEVINSNQAINSSSIIQSSADNQSIVEDLEDKRIVNDAVAIANSPIYGDISLVTGQVALVGSVIVNLDNDEQTIVNITWSSEIVEQWTFTSLSSEGIIFATPKFDPVETQEFTLIGTAKYKTATATTKINGIIAAKSTRELKTIAELADADVLANRLEVAIEGIVCKVPSVTAGIYVMDDTGITYVYLGDNELFETGYKVRIEGINLVYSGDYQTIRQIDATGENASVTIIDTSIQELPLSAARAASIPTTQGLTPANTTETDYRTIFELEGFLVLFVNSYGNPTIEVATENVAKPSSYVALYPASAGIEKTYAHLFGEFSYTSAGQTFPSTSKIGDGYLYKVYATIYDINSSGKFRWVPLAVKPVN